MFLFQNKRGAPANPQISYRSVYQPIKLYYLPYNSISTKLYFILKYESYNQ